MGLLDRFAERLRQRRFAQMVMMGIRQAGETRRVQYDPKQFCIHPGDGSGTVSYLANVYGEYRQASEEARQTIVQNFVRMWFTTFKELPEKFEDLHPDLLPTVRPRAYFELIALRSKISGGNMPALPQQILADHLAVSLVYDRPESMRSITQDDLDRWGVTFYEALEAARQNLAELKYTMGGLQGGGHHVYMSMSTDSYGSSRLLMLDLIRQLEVLGDPVAMVPTRDSLLLTGTDDVDGLGVMSQLAEKASQQPRAMSGMAFRLEGDEWVPWIPDRDHPHYQKFRAMRLQDLRSDYAEQAELLQALCETNREDLYVAKFSGMREEGTGEIVSFCSWTKGVPSLLPRTDRVGLLADLTGEPIMVEWDRLMEVAGDLMEPMGIYPERYRVVDFLSESQLEMLRLAAVVSP